MADVLVVDDSETMRASVRKILEEGGISCKEADNGLSAIQAFEADSNYKLIITDYNMPEMDGITAIEKIRGMSGGDKVIVFMLTTESSPDLKNLGKAVGIKAWITKPFNEAKFLAAVKKMLAI